MARYKDEQCRICRREGQKLFLKGSRCYSDKCSVTRRNYAPGQHGQKRTKLSEYGTQLREKQKTRSFYGVGEKQFRKYFDMASSKKGITGTVLLQILESRLDNVVYRLGFGTSRAQARQLVTHGNIQVNGNEVSIQKSNLIPKDIQVAGDISSAAFLHNCMAKAGVSRKRSSKAFKTAISISSSASFVSTFNEFSFFVA